MRDRESHHIPYRMFIILTAIQEFDTFNKGEVLVGEVRAITLVIIAGISEVPALFSLANRRQLFLNPYSCVL